MRVETRFYAELNDLLPRDRRGLAFTVEVAPGTTVKDLAESLGVPHTEIDVILVNDEPVGLAHRIGDGDRVSVYPMFETIDVTSLVPLRPAPLDPPRFALDVHLGKLARGLRLLGFDTRWNSHASDEELVQTALGEHRILLTRDRGLLKRSAVTHGYLVRETAWRAQTQEVLRRFDLFEAIEPFRRCLECNGQLEPVAKADVEDQLSARTRREYDEFRRCLGCGRIYWRGSHFDRLRTVVDDLRRVGPDASERGFG